MSNVTNLPKMGDNSLKLLLRVIRDKTALAKTHHEKWIDNMVELAVAVHTARGILTVDKDFGEWWEENGLHVAWGKNERAILAKLGSNPDAAYTVLYEADSTSLRMIKKSGAIDDRFDISVKTEPAIPEPEEQPEPTLEPEETPEPEAEEQPEPEAEEQPEPEAEEKPDQPKTKGKALSLGWDGVS